MNMREPFLGGHYVARSVNSSDNWMVNLYAETVPNAQGGKDVGALYRTPGTEKLATVGIGKIRGEYQMGAYLYVASGHQLYQVSSTWNATLLGTITGDGKVWMAGNGTQVFVSCNPDAFIYNATTAVFQAINDPDFPGSEAVDYIDGYFVFNDPGTQAFYITAINDGSDIDALDFASAEGAPDDIVSLIVDHREVWLFGDLSTEVWYNSGAADFPFARIQGAFIEHGCAAAGSVAKADNSVFWLGKDERGKGIVWRANGYTPARVSDYSFETAVAEYSAISDAIAYTYQEQGHAFYVISFPTGNATWVFDASTNLWHRRSYRDPVTGAMGRHRSNCHAFFAGLHVVGDYVDGRIYALRTDIYTDDFEPQRWIRRWRALGTGKNNLNRTFHHSLTLDAEMGMVRTDADVAAGAAAGFAEEAAEAATAAVGAAADGDAPAAAAAAATAAAASTAAASASTTAAATGNPLATAAAAASATAAAASSVTATAAADSSEEAATEVLVHFDAVPPVDALGNATVTLTDSAAATTAPKYGARSLKYIQNGTGSLGLAAMTGIDFPPATGLQPWTLESWFMADAFPEASVRFGFQAASSLLVELAYDTGTDNTTLNTQLSSNGITYDIVDEAVYVVTNPTAGTYFHFAISWDGVTYRIYYQGEEVAAYSSIVPAYLDPDDTIELFITAAHDGVTTVNYYMDEFRYSHVCWYQDGDSFTPAGPFLPS